MSRCLFSVVFLRQSAAWARWMEFVTQMAAAELMHQGANALVNAQHELEQEQRLNAKREEEWGRLVQERDAQVNSMHTTAETQAMIADAVASAVQSQREQFDETLKHLESEYERRLQHLLSLKERDDALLVKTEQKLKSGFAHTIKRAVLEKEMECNAALEKMAKRIQRAELSISQGL